MSGFAPPPNPTTFGRLRVASTPHYCNTCSSTHGVTRQPSGVYTCQRCIYDAARLDANNHLLRTQAWCDQGPATA